MKETDSATPPIRILGPAAQRQRLQSVGPDQRHARTGGVHHYVTQRLFSLLFAALAVQAPLKTRPQWS
jgi:hypothetical protein